MTQNKMVWLRTERHQKERNSWKEIKDCGEKKKLEILHPSTHIKQK